jgi:predicted RNase H-like nuclease (RuvC/YqgF family)
VGDYVLQRSQWLQRERCATRVITNAAENYRSAGSAQQRISEYENNVEAGKVIVSLKRRITDLEEEIKELERELKKHRRVESRRRRRRGS